MNQIEKNNVPSKNQLKEKSPIFFENKNGKGLRILFVGNSITLHGYKEDIGWFGENYGMAASCKEKDYVHLVLSGLKQKYADIACCICQAAEWERNYKTGTKFLEKCKLVREFDADIIIMRIVENCSHNNYEGQIFQEQYKKMIDFFNKSGKAKIILTTSFWKHIADNEIIEVGEERGYTTLNMGELGEDESMKAIGLFEHSGVANHPGDKGMKSIADTILNAIL